MRAAVAPAGLRLRNNRAAKLRALYVAPNIGSSGDGWTAMWTTSQSVPYAGSWVAQQVAAAARLGANGIGTTVPLAAVLGGGSTAAAALGSLGTFLTDCQARGLRVQLTGGFYTEWGASTISQVAAAWQTIAQVCDRYANVVSLDLVNEINGSPTPPTLATATGWMSALTPVVRAVTVIPITYSEVIYGATPAAAGPHGDGLWSGIWAQTIAAYSDLRNVHPYYVSGDPAAADVVQYRAQPYYRRWYVGECGKVITSPSAATSRWVSLGVLAALPDCLGSIGFCIADYAASPNQAGIFDSALANQRAYLTTPFAAWPSSR